MSVQLSCCCCLVLLFGVAAILSAPVRQPPPPPSRGGSRRRPGTKEEVQSYLSHFGWNGRSGRRDNGIDDDLQTSLRQYQKFFGLQVTGEADNETLDLMATPRCGMPDTNATSTRRRRYVLSGTKWRDLAMTYSIQNFNANLTEASQRNAFQRAFQDWKDALPALSFTEVKTAARLKLAFLRLDHGDGYSFDGRGGTLAHAFFPPTGLCHFDNDEQWATDQPCSNSNIDLRQVAAHEFGHLFGLQHSSVKTAVMYAYYSCKKNFALDKDDIQGIQALYGGTSSTSSTKYSSTSSSTSSTSRSTTTTTRTTSSTTKPTSSTTKPTSLTTKPTSLTTKASTPRTTTTPRQTPCRWWWWWC